MPEVARLQIPQERLLVQSGVGVGAGGLYQQQVWPEEEQEVLGFWAAETQLEGQEEVKQAKERPNWSVQEKGEGVGVGELFSIKTFCFFVEGIQVFPLENFLSIINITFPFYL